MKEQINDLGFICITMSSPLSPLDSLPCHRPPPQNPPSFSIPGADPADDFSFQTILQLSAIIVDHEISTEAI